MKKKENEGFVCVNCGAAVLPLRRGGYRNHCPFCLCSVHADEKPGDRMSDCLGVMRPVGVKFNTQKGWQVLHKCERCGFERLNLLTDDVGQPDNMEIVYKMMGTAGM